MGLAAAERGTESKDLRHERRPFSNGTLSGGPADPKFMNFPDTLPIPDEVMTIARRLEGEGHETWCVGGAVRDNLLGETSFDFDLATAARPEVVRGLFRRTIPIGMEHGTVAVLDRRGQPHEVTTFRRDVRTDGRHAEVEFGVSLVEDLARRDFTINAIAYHPVERTWCDPHGGADDLDARLVRAVGNPAARFREDYLRIVRALRFAARFDFVIEEATWDAACRSADGLGYLSAERVRDEWFKSLITAQRVGDAVRLWQEVGAAAAWLPETGPADTDQLARLERFPERDPVLMTAWLSADPGTTLARLRCSRGQIERGKRLGTLRGSAPGAGYPDPGSPREVRRWLSRVDAAADDLITIAEVDGSAHGLREAVRQARQSKAPLGVRDLAVSGTDLVAAGIPEGPAVGQTLRRLLDEVLDDPDLNRRDLLVERARAIRDGAS